jgi:hypothetical protein
LRGAPDSNLTIFPLFLAKGTLGIRRQQQGELQGNVYSISILTAVWKNSTVDYTAKDGPWKILSTRFASRIMHDFLEISNFKSLSAHFASMLM